ncbi:methylated-DNA-protein-cysteine methyltransferase related protein [Acinetobacter marinus]|uniref:Methylated-DNA-protein-cysteine methyltransferase related protein n=2 Tax=Acinetobacter marinus TaxID=281375 RepID=A0A1G6GUM8_9GAMM|nr:methylated-DNA-protein-cysteine methyltransferase related protein [Acinetobacter marinus]
MSRKNKGYFSSNFSITWKIYPAQLMISMNAKSTTNSPKTSATKELAEQILAVVALIPYGKVASYGQVARMAGLPKHARLVGKVLGNIDDRSTLPWYRVVNAQGKIRTTMLTEKGQNLQQQLLLAEGVLVKNEKIDLKTYAW